MIAASGGFTDAASRASAASAVSTTSKPASLSTTRSARRICISSSQTRTRWLIARPAPAVDGRLRRGVSPVASPSGNSTTKVVPCPGSDSTETRPPFASTKPLTIARPSPAPACDGSSARPW